MRNDIQNKQTKKRLATYMIFIFCLSISLSSWAQDISVNGVVKDANGGTIPGVTITIKNTNKGAVTDLDGKFRLSVASDATLVFTYVGFKTQEIQVANQSQINVTLSEDLEQLEEVVVVGYGIRKKSHNTGAIAQVEGKDIAAIQTVRVDDALAGKLSGVLIQNQSGEPGADPKIQIRAASSLSGDSGPLIVVDGYPISGSLATINPNDIASLEVLKDAASAAIYGSRGANGVILVTTKKGKPGRASFSYNAYTSFSSKYSKNILPTASEWASQIESGIASGRYDVSEVNEEIMDLQMEFYRNSPDVQAVEDWLFRTAVTTNHDFSVSGGSENVNVFASLGYLDSEGVAITQEFERYNGRLNVDAKLGDKFKAGLNINGSISDRAILAHDMRDLLRAYSVHPVIHTEASIAYVQQLNLDAQGIGLGDFDGGFGGGSADSETPMNSSIQTLQPGDYAHDWHYGGRTGLWGGSSNQGSGAKLLERRDTQKNYFGNVNAYLEYSILDGLVVRTTLGGDLRDTRDYFHQLSQADRRGQISQTSLDQTDTKRSSVQNETTLNYTKVIGNHDISAVAGVEYQNLYIRATSIEGGNLPGDSPLNYGFLDPESIAVSERDETISRRSVFGRINYAFDDRYLASFSLRRDGDSRFGANNRFETFPAVSLGWNIHKESFFNLEEVSNLKLRFSTGTLGTTSFLGAYNSLSLLNTGATVLGTGYLIPEDLANPDLTWQTNKETNYGVSLGFFGNRITLGVDYYTSDIEDMLINQSVSEVLGTPSIRLNSGDVRSSGMELELGAVVLEQNGLSWNVNANLSTVSTEITDLGGLDELPQVQYGTSGRGPIFRNRVGGEIGEMWALQTTGLVEDIYIANPAFSPGINSGESYVVDQNNDGVIDENDYVKVGQNTPDFYWGLSSTLSYKNFDLSLQFQGAQGAEVYNIDPLYYNSQWGGRLRSSFDADGDGIADHNGQHYARNRDQTDHGIQDASYVALRNMTIGYSLRPSLISKVGISSARIYLAATNLLYLMGSDYTSYNPEGIETTDQGGDTYLGPITSGVQVGASPIIRSFTMGININF